ncbi:hypothetical protein G7046_g4065 [Stylonectria norvegica]|nr:hypothetical protein G7046_g4065 [Stylonectria norvegica]
MFGTSIPPQHLPMPPQTNPSRLLNISFISRPAVLPNKLLSHPPRNLQPLSLSTAVLFRPATTPQAHPLSTTRALNMASDDDYTAFLNKANQDSSAAAPTTQQKPAFKTKDAGSQAPKPIRDAIQNAVYVSDADEPFEEVSLRWDGSGGLPDEVAFATLIQHPDPKTADVDILDPTDWDPKGQYTAVVEAVREASRGNDVRVYRVVRDSTRVDYWVVTAEKGQVLGVKALAIES